MHTEVIPDRQVPSDAATTKALEGVQDAIARDYPWAAPERIAEVLRSRYERTRDAKVQNYRLLLAERETRVQLRHEAPI
ncbi:MAG: three-helix bundle dimerization domain-containing protein [Acidimicrobiales bacterium]